MNDRHRAIRAAISVMAPRRAKEYIKSFELPEDEENFILLHDVQGLSYVQIADKCHTTVDVIKRKRQRAYAKIADWVDHEKRREG